jgi:hypothetical protein
LVGLKGDRVPAPLRDRLSRIREVATDEMIFVNLRFLASLKTPELTPIQQQLLEFIEKMHGLS